MSKFGSDLSQVIFDQDIFIFFTPKSSCKFSKKDQETFWNTLSFDLKKDLLNIESFKESDSLDCFLKKNFECVPKPFWSPSGSVFFLDPSH